ncbi:MAG: aminotransferase class IV [Sporichthyaceae bacterium]
MKVWLDDALVDPGAARVSVFDHGFTVGDGVFETTKVVRGRPFALTRHLDRLARSAAALGLVAPEHARVRTAVAAVLAQLTQVELARVRITLTAGDAPLGSGRGSGPPTLVVAASPMDLWPASESIRVVPWRRNERSAVTGVKTTSYAENAVALAAVRAAGAGEAVFVNTAGELCEGTGTNLFLVHDGRVRTPALDSGCLAGVTRALVLAWCPQVEEAVLRLDDLYSADEVFLTSSTRDVQAVRSVDGVRPGGSHGPVPGPVTAQIAAAFAARAARDEDPA